MNFAFSQRSDNYNRHNAQQTTSLILHYHEWHRWRSQTEWNPNTNPVL